MGNRIRAVPARVCAGKPNDCRKKPPDFADRDVIDAILAEVEWEEDGVPGVVLDGWWSDRWSAPPDS